MVAGTVWDRLRPAESSSHDGKFVEKFERVTDTFHLEEVKYLRIFGTSDDNFNQEFVFLMVAGTVCDLLRPAESSSHDGKFVENIQKFQ